MKNTPKSEIDNILSHQEPSRFVYAPNYWQWFKHQKDHHLLPDEIKHCNTLLDLYRFLGLDVFSRNVYSDPEKYWFGGICDEIIDDFEVLENKTLSGKDKVTAKEYRSSKGCLNEKLVYVFTESTLVQNQFLVTDYVRELEVFKHLVSKRRWKFNKEKFKTVSQSVGDDGVVIAGEFFSPLKMLHFAMGPVNTVYFLMEYPEQSKLLLALHEKAQLDCIRQCVENGVKVVMSMDNLDTMFHPPDYVKEYSSSYYEKASAICHAHGACFFIHACGQQKANLELISSYHVDGLEGVASHPLGDITYVEAMENTRDNFIITGGISAMETRDLKTKEEIFNYVENLFRNMLPHKSRFIFSSSCNTAIDTSWETIKHFRDAWLKYRDMQ
jgi:uroporphyrinogen-III decarboxylase